MDISIAGLLKPATADAGLVPSPPLSAAGRLYRDMRERIVSMELPPDTTLSRNQLAKHYEVSLTPLREAMQRLEQDGLIRIFPQSRTVVTRIDIDKLNEAHFLRVALESEVVRRLAESADPIIIAKARRIHGLQDSLVGNLDEIALFNELDEAFHQTLFAGVGQPDLYRLAKARSGHLARARRLDLPKEGKFRAIVKAHGEILDTIEAGDAPGAMNAMRRHLTGTVARIEILRREYPDYFQAPSQD